MANKSASYATKTPYRLEKDVLPWIGSRPAREITVPERLAMLRRIESRGAATLRSDSAEGGSQ